MKKIVFWSAAAALGLLAPATRAQNQEQAGAAQNVQGQNQAPAMQQQAPNAPAPRQWARTHRGRAAANRRLNNMNRRIAAGARNGQLTPRQARRMHRADRAIRMEERRMARRDANNGHLKPWQLRKINRQQNRLNRRIYRARRR